MSRLDPKNDIVFKKVFGNHIHLVKSLLNDLLMLTGEDVIDTLEYLTPELLPEALDLKNTVVDVHCIDKNKRAFIVEMQMLWTDAFKNRVLFNASKVFVSQAKKGWKYNKLKPVYSLNLVNDSYHPDPNEYYHRYQIVEVEGTGERIEGLEFVFIELNKFLNNPNSTIKPRLRKIWLTLLSVSESSNIPSELLEDSLTSEALELIQIIHYTPEERAAYNKYWDDINSTRALLEEREEKAEAKGKSEGIKEGKAEGKAEEKMMTAKKLKSKGMSPKDIAEVTGLSVAQIENL